jgi:putative restriction endonuclease
VQESHYRIAVLNNYGGRCAVTGLCVPELLMVTRILPRASHPEQSLNISNGICFSALYHMAFLHGLVGLDDELRLLVMPRLRHVVDASNFQTFFGIYVGRSIQLPRNAIKPDAAALRHHREIHRL